MTKQTVIPNAAPFLAAIQLISNVPGKATNCVSSNAYSKSSDVNPSTRP